MRQIPIQYSEVEELYGRTVAAGFQSIGVTAAKPGEGSSTIAYALARRTAAAGKKTLLVDFNMATPSVGVRLALVSKTWQPGSDSAVDAIHPLGSTRLYALPAPSCTVDAWAFREVSQLSAQIAQWHKDYEVVIADTSSLTKRNRGNIPPEVVCAACSGTVLVVRSGRTREVNVIEARDRLDRAGARILGSVMNDMNAPGLAAELMRETRRLDRFAPKTMEKLRGVIRRSSLLNQVI
jgi:Mrp family chromosome partitioning ATPase